MNSSRRDISLHCSVLQIIVEVGLVPFLCLYRNSISYPEFDNAGAMMSVDETLLCSFQVKSIMLFS